MEVTAQEKEYIDGVACQYLCHIETAKKAGNVFPAHYHYYIEVTLN